MLPDTQEPKVFYKNLIFFKTDCCNTNFEENTEHLNLENFTKNRITYKINKFKQKKLRHIL